MCARKSIPGYLPRSPVASRVHHPPMVAAHRPVQLAAKTAIPGSKRSRQVTVAVDNEIFARDSRLTRTLLAWELGDGLGHVVRLRYIAQSLIKAGACVTAA